MTQSWVDLLFAHWPIEPDALAPHVPPQLSIDTSQDRAWIGITPFEVRNFRVRWSPPVPLVSTFPEINVRTYVNLDGKPGVFFFSLDAGNRLAVAGARLLYRLPYFAADMSIHRGSDGRIGYRSERTGRSPNPAQLHLAYAPTGPAAAAQPGTLDHWFTERYCLYTVSRGGRVRRTNIHHNPWPLQPASAEIDCNSMTAPVGLEISGDPHLHYARRLDVLFWPPKLVR